MRTPAHWIRWKIELTLHAVMVSVFIYIFFLFMKIKTNWQCCTVSFVIPRKVQVSESECMREWVSVKDRNLDIEHNPSLWSVIHILKIWDIEVFFISVNFVLIVQGIGKLFFECVFVISITFKKNIIVNPSQCGD